MGASLNTGGRNGKRGYRPMSEINVTPFVDVMLVLLIVFMVSAPLLTSGVPVNLPDSKASPLREEDDKPLEITLQENGAVFVGETELTEDRLVPMLTAITENNAERLIYIRGAETLPYGDVMRIIGSINAGGFKKVALITEPAS